VDNANDSEDDYVEETESHMELDNGSEYSETPEQRNGSAAPNIPGLIRSNLPTKMKVEKVLRTVNIMETRRNWGIKTK
jgi:hypothetical protein